MVRTQVLARVTTTLLVREQSKRIAGKNMDNRGSKSGPRPLASAAMRSMAGPDKRVLSELRAPISGRDNDLSAGINS